MVLNFNKTLTTFEKSAKLFDMSLCSMSTHHSVPLSVIGLICFDLSQRLNEVRYVGLAALSMQAKVSENEFKKLTHAVYETNGHLINCPTAQNYVCLALDIEIID